MSKSFKKKILETVELIDFITEITQINCSECKKEYTKYLDTHEAIVSFYEEGWRVKNEKCLCPKCGTNEIK